MAKEKTNLNINPEDQSLRLALPITIGAYLVFLALGYIFKSQNHTITNTELGFSILAVSFALPFYLLVTRLHAKFKEDAERLNHKFNFNYWFWKDLIISLSYSILFGIIGLLVALLVDQAFKQFIYQPFTYAMWPALAAGVWAYFTVNLVKNFKATDMVNVIGVFLIGGVSASAVLNPNPTWWNESISYLGMNQIISAKIFNISLILSGLLLLTMSTFILRRFDYMLEQKMINERSHTFLKYAFIIAPIGLACVGFFPYMPEFPRSMIHNLSAYGAFGLFGLVMFLVYWIMPFFSKYFMRINYAFFAILCGIFAMNVVGYLTLALTEMMSFGIIAVWLVLFLRSIDGILDWGNNPHSFK